MCYTVAVVQVDDLHGKFLYYVWSYISSIQTSELHFPACQEVKFYTSSNFKVRTLYD